MLTVVKTSWPPRLKGCVNSFWMRSATSMTSSSSRDVFEEDRELVAAQARDRISGAQAGLQSARDPDQQLIADHVAETVVDDLEAVEVEEEHGEHHVFARGARADRPASNDP